MESITSFLQCGSGFWKHQKNLMLSLALLANMKTHGLDKVR